MVERVVASTEDDRGVLWETVQYLDAAGAVIGGGTRAVCRPSSCASGKGHQCGILDVGVEALVSPSGGRRLKGIGQFGPPT